MIKYTIEYNNWIIECFPVLLSDIRSLYNDYPDYFLELLEQDFGDYYIDLKEQNKTLPLHNGDLFIIKYPKNNFDNKHCFVYRQYDDITECLDEFFENFILSIMINWE